MTRRILFLIGDLGYHGAARQLTLLAAHLPRDRFQPLVLSLRPAATHWADELRAAGVAVADLGWQRPFDLLPYARLGRLARQFQPDVIHAWGLPGMRLLPLTRLRCPRWLVSAAVPSRGAIGWADQRLLHCADHVLASSAWEAEQQRGAGVPPERLLVAAPAVLPLPALASWSPGLPGRYIVSVGPFRPNKGYRDAIWASDILGFLYDDLRMLLIGGGPDQARLTAFARASGSLARMRMLGPVRDLGSVLRCANVCWVLARGSHGINFALEAMASGVPFIATRTGPIAELIRDGETGLLTPPRDKASLARLTRLIFEDPDRAAALGSAAAAAAKEFSVERLVRQVTPLYD